MRSRRTLHLSGAAAVVVVALLVVWAVRDGGGSEDFAAAEVLPADADVVRYLDRAGAAQQLGLGDDVDSYLDSMSESSWVGTPLSAYLVVMEDAPFDELDVDWWASVEVGDEAPLNVYRLDDAVDLGAVADALGAAGFEESELDGHRRFKAGAGVAVDDNGLVEGGLPVLELQDVTVVEDEHLLVTGSAPERIVDVVSGDADALADADGFGALTDRAGAEPPLYAVAYLGTDGLCDEQVELLASSTSPEIADRLMESGLGDLGAPEARGIFVVPDGDGVRAVAVLGFDSEETAEQDAGARTVWLESGIDPVTNRPNGDILDVGTVEVDDELVVIQAGSDAALAIQVAENGFGPLACAG